METAAEAMRINTQILEDLAFLKHQGGGAEDKAGRKSRQRDIARS